MKLLLPSLTYLTLFFSINAQSQCSAEVTADNTSSGCFSFNTPGTITDEVNVTVVGNDISRTSGAGWGSSGAASTSQVNNDMFMYSIVNETNTHRMFGLSTSNSNAHYNSIDYAFNLYSSFGLRIFEGGLLIGNYGNYSTGDTLKIEVESNVVKYYQNSVLLYQSLVAPILPLIFDASLYSNGATVEDITFGGIFEGDFTCTATNMGPAPTYQWKLNGGNVGSNSPNYSNTSMNDGDIVHCEVTPDLGFCGGIPETSNAVTVNTPSQNTVAVVTPTYSASGCIGLETEVSWTDNLNVNVSGNSITRNFSPNAWGNSGAASNEQVGNNSYMYTIANETSSYRMVGLSNSNTDEHYNTIEYAMYLMLGGTLRIYESGTFIGTFGTYSIGDTLYVKVESNNVNYYKNSTLLYSSLVAPTLPLIVDAAIYSNGGSVENVTIGGFLQGDFTCSVIDGGASPTYQWKLNGGNVGSNSPNYTNAGLVDSDVVHCEVTPDLAGCGGSLAISNLVVASDEFATTQWSGATNTDWATSTNWSNGVPNSNTNVIIPTGLGTYPIIGATATSGALTIESGASIIISGSNQLSVFGNWDNSGTVSTNSSMVILEPEVCNENSSSFSNSAPITFHDLTLQNFADVTISGSNVTIEGTLLINEGDLVTNDSLLIASSAGGTGNIGEITDGSIFGEVEVQRYIDPGATNWRYFGSPVQNCKISQFNDDFNTSGYPGSNNPSFPFVSAYRYDEIESPGLGYFAPVSADNIIPMGQGWQFWSGDSLEGTDEFTVDLRGEPWQGPQTLPVTFTNTGTPTEDGYCHVANPYASTIDWDDADWTKTNMSDTYFVFDPDTELYATYSTVGGGTNGGTQYIASMQSMWVQATSASPTLSLDEGVKHNFDAGFWKKNDLAGFFIRILDGARHDEARINNIPGASEMYETAGDAKKFNIPAIDYAQISMLNSENIELSIHSMDMNAGEERRIPLVTKVFENGVYTIEFEGTTNIPSTYLQLEDTKTGQVYNITEGASFDFALEVGVLKSPRFYLIVGGNNSSPAATAPTTDLNMDAVEMIYLPESNEVQVANADQLSSKLIYLYDTQGRMIEVYQLGGNKTETIQLPSTITNGIYIVGNNETQLKIVK